MQVGGLLKIAIESLSPIGPEIVYLAFDLLAELARLV
jgi:hypothetical protein